MKKQQQVGILLYDYMDILDFAGPAEVLSLTAVNKGYQALNLYKKKMLPNNPFRVFTITENGEQIRTHTGIKVVPDYDFENAPHFDIIIIPGGPLRAVKAISKNENVQKWILKHAVNNLICSVCTGAFILAETGLLSDKSATTHHLAIPILQKTYKAINVVAEKIVHEDNIITSAGVSSGINMGIYIVEQSLGYEAAQRIAKTIEFPYK